MRSTPSHCRARFDLAAACLILALCVPLCAVEVTFFPASVWSPDVAKLNQNLGLTNGYVFEDFEEDHLRAGVSMIHANFHSAEYYSTNCSLSVKDARHHLITAFTPRLGEPGTGPFTTNAWVGPGTAVNFSDLGDGDLRVHPVNPVTAFRFSPGARSVGIGLSGQARDQRNFDCSLRGYEPVLPGNHLFFVTLMRDDQPNPVYLEYSLESIAGTNWTPGLARNGYLRVDAGTDETIVALGFRAAVVAIPNCLNPDPPHDTRTVGTGEHLGFDHLAYKPSNRRVFKWVNGFCYYKTDEEGVEYAVCAGSEDWTDPCNWVLDGIRGGGVPGTNDLDKVMIYGASVPAYPTNAVGRVAELWLKGHQTPPGNPMVVFFGAPDLTVLDVIRLEFAQLGTRRAPMPTRIVLAETGRLTTKDLIPEASPWSGVGYNATLENHGVIAPEGALKVSGRINNHGVIEFKGSEPRNTCFEWSSTDGTFSAYNDIVPGLIVNYRRMTKLADKGLVCFTCNLTNLPGAVFEVLDGRIDFLDGVFRQPRSIHNAGQLAASSSNAVLRFIDKSYVTATAGATFAGPGRFAFNRLELSNAATVENGDFGQVYGPGDLTITGLGRTLASAGFGNGADFTGPADSSGRLPGVIVAPGASLLFPASSVDFMGRLLENHGVLRIESDFTFRSDVPGLPGHVLNHADGRLEIATKRIKAFPQQADGVIENRGVTVAKGPAFENSFWDGRFINSGSFEIEGTSITFFRFSQDSGSLVLRPGASVNVFDLAELNGGDFVANGRLGGGGALVLGTTLRVGSSPSVFSLAMSHFTNRSTTVWEFEIGGLKPGVEHDQVVVEGHLDRLPLAGTLRVRLINDFVPVAGDQFHLIREDLPLRDGTFTTYDFPPLPDGLQWVPRYDREGLRLVVIQPLRLDAVVKADGKSLTLAWPASLPGPIVLESTETLAPPAWKTVTLPVADDGASKSVALPVEAAVAGKYFRLRSGP